MPSGDGLPVVDVDHVDSRAHDHRSRSHPPSPANSEPLPEPKGPTEILGRVGGQVGPMALSSDGQNGYLAMGNGFLVLDLDDPARPLARIDLEAEWVAGVAVFENALYVSIWPPYCCPRDTYGSLLVYDLSDPIAPRYVDQRGLHRSSGPIAIDAEGRRLGLVQ